MANLKLAFLFSIGSLVLLASHISQSYILEPEAGANFAGDQIKRSNFKATEEDENSKSLSGSDDSAAAPQSLPMYVVGNLFPTADDGEIPCLPCAGNTDFECKTICKEYGLKKSKCDGCICLCNN